VLTVTARERQRRTQRQLLIAIPAALATAGVMVLAVSAGRMQVYLALVFFGMVTAGEVCRFTVPGGREVAPAATASALGYGWLAAGSYPSTQSAVQAVTVTAAAILIAALAHAAASRPLAWEAMARRLVTVAVAAFAFAMLHRPGALWSARMDLVISLLLVAAVGTADLMLAAWLRARVTGGRFARLAADEWSGRAVLTVATVATVTLLIVVVQAAGLLGVLVFALPVIAVQVAFQRLARIHAATSQAMRGVPRAMEIAGYVPVDHAHRVSRLAVAIGQQMAMSERDLLDLEYAALLHDIGQFTLPVPIPGGAAILAAPGEQRHIGQVGAKMIKRARHFGNVADIVQRQYDPCPTGRREPRDETVAQAPAQPSPSLASRILKAANAYDDMLGDRQDKSSKAAVLDLMTLHAPPTYDPDVIAALQRHCVSTDLADEATWDKQSDLFGFRGRRR
jgi:HD domain